MTILYIGARALLAAAALGATAAHATAIIYYDYDDGAGVAGPFPRAASVEALARESAASFDPVHVETFEAIPNGFARHFAFAGGTISYEGSFSGAGITGVWDFSLGDNFGFNTTAGGSKWLGFPNFSATSATITFTRPTHAFGFYLTGSEQQIYNSHFTLTWGGGTRTIRGTPLGGVAYNAVIDTIAFTSVTIRSADNLGDAWGIDGILYTAAIPEPSSWSMVITGFGVTGAAMRRRRGFA